MKTSTKNLEQIKLEYDALIQEYNSLRNELIATLESARQVTNYTFVLTGLLFPTFPLITGYLSQTKTGTILFIIPVVFYILAWTSLRYTILCNSLSTYIRDHIAPKVRECLVELGTATERNDRIFRWEDKGKNTLKKYGKLYFPIAGAHYGLPLLGAVLVVVITLIFYNTYALTLSSLDYALIITNLLLLIYSCFWGIKVELLR